MTEEQARMAQGSGGQPGARAGRFLGSLKDALVAASRDDHHTAASAPRDPEPVRESKAAMPPAAAAAPVAEPAAVSTDAGTPPRNDAVRREAAVTLSAAEAAREVKAQASLKAAALPDRHQEADAAPTTRVLRAAKPPAAEDAQRTQLVRGRQAMKRGEFTQDPVVAWLVVVGGPGLGSYRPIFEGNNTVGRAPTNRVPLDFGDGAISSEEQAYIRYDAADRSFLFVPNLAKTNVVSINDKRPTGAVELESMDVIVMGRTQLVFVPFCGPEFDWSEITETKD